MTIALTSLIPLANTLYSPFLLHSVPVSVLLFPSSYSRLLILLLEKCATPHNEKLFTLAFRFNFLVFIFLLKNEFAFVHLIPNRRVGPARCTIADFGRPSVLMQAIIIQCLPLLQKVRSRLQRERMKDAVRSMSIYSSLRMWWRLSIGECTLLNGTRRHHESSRC